MKKINKKEKNNNNILSIILILIIFGIGGYFLYKEYEEVKKNREFFNQIKGVAKVEEYTIYGTHLNIKGSLIVENDVTTISLVLKKFTDEKEYPLFYNKDGNNIDFYLSSYINDGLNLEEITDINHYIFVKVTNNDEIMYYSLENKTNYDNLEYYTITNDSKNYKISLKIDYFKLKNREIPYFKLTTKSTVLNDEIYDIVIDPGHGGNDSGALSLDNKYHEADIVLDVAKELKISLEKLGLKVKLTREKNETLASYGNEGRAVIPNKAKAKLLLSLHLNSSEYKVIKGGVEVYMPAKTNATFAKTIADNIVVIANTNYSINKTDKVGDGIYVRTFTPEDIKEANEYANKNGYEPYNINTSTPALYMLRETGGIMTNAYIDGRNKNYDKNPYYNSNIAVESYLIELGFINYQADLNNILNNSSLYVEAITKSIQEYYNL